MKQIFQMMEEEDNLHILKRREEKEAGEKDSRFWKFSIRSLTCRNRRKYKYVL